MGQGQALPEGTLLKIVSTSIILAAAVLGILAVPAVQGDVANLFVPSFTEVQNDKGPVFRDGCLVLGNRVNSGPCVYGNPRSKKVVVVFGDSHALHWTPALLRIAETRDWRLIALLRANCTSALVDTDRICNRWRRNSLARMAELKPSLVILGTNTGRNVLVRDGRGRTLDRKASDQKLTAGMVTTAKRMLANGSKVTLIRDLFTAPFDPSGCVQQNPVNPSVCNFRAVRPNWLSFDYRAARRIRQVQVVDPLARICPGGTCQATSGRVLKFRDRAHLSATYVATLSGWLDRRLQKP
jgi:hypothetical protein